MPGRFEPGRVWRPFEASFVLLATSGCPRSRSRLVARSGGLAGHPPFRFFLAFWPGSRARARVCSRRDNAGALFLRNLSLLVAQIALLTPIGGGSFSGLAQLAGSGLSSVPSVALEWLRWVVFTVAARVADRRAASPRSSLPASLVGKVRPPPRLPVGASSAAGFASRSCGSRVGAVVVP